MTEDASIEDGWETVYPWQCASPAAAIDATTRRRDQLLANQDLESNAEAQQEWQALLRARAELTASDSSESSKVGMLIRNNSSKTLHVSLAGWSIQIFPDKRCMINPSQETLVTLTESWSRPFFLSISAEMGEGGLKKRFLSKVKVDSLEVLTVEDGDEMVSWAKQELHETDLDTQIVKSARRREIYATADYYTVLGVPQDASVSEIKKAFRRLIKVTHSDRNLCVTATEETQALLEAWAVLSDPEQRKKYDTLLSNKAGYFSQRFWKQMYDDGRLRYFVGGVILCAGGLLITVMTAGSSLSAAVAGGAVGGGMFGAGSGTTKYSTDDSAVVDGPSIRACAHTAACFAVAGILGGSISAGLTTGMLEVAAGAEVAAPHITVGAIDGAAWGMTFAAAEGIEDGQYQELCEKGLHWVIVYDVLKVTLTSTAAGALGGAIMCNVSSKLAEISGELSAPNRKIIQEGVLDGLEQLGIKQMIESSGSVAASVVRTSVQVALDTAADNMIKPREDPPTSNLVAALEPTQLVGRDMPEGSTSASEGYISFRNQTMCWVRMLVVCSERDKLIKEYVEPDRVFKLKVGMTNIRVSFEVHRVGNWVSVKKYDRLVQRWAVPIKTHSFFYEAPMQRRYTIAGPVGLEAVMQVCTSHCQLLTCEIRFEMKMNCL